MQQNVRKVTFRAGSATFLQQTSSDKDCTALAWRWQVKLNMIVLLDDFALSFCSDIRRDSDIHHPAALRL